MQRPYTLQQFAAAVPADDTTAPISGALSVTFVVTELCTLLTGDCVLAVHISLLHGIVLAAIRGAGLCRMLAGSAPGPSGRRSAQNCPAPIRSRLHPAGRRYRHANPAEAIMHARGIVLPVTARA